MRSSERRSGVAVRLDRHVPRPVPALVLDSQQQAVVDHRDGHLLVLAGPGTGKTATLAELMVARIQAEDQALLPEQILALTFGRRAADELSERVSNRLGGGAVPVVSTFHSFAYGVLRAHADPTDFASPPRLLVAAEQEARLRELLTHSIEEGRLRWPESLAGAVGTRGIAEQVRTLLARARGQGLDGRDLARIGRREGVPVWAALGGFFEEYLATLEFEGSMDYSELILRAAVLANDARVGRALRATYRLVVVDEYQDTDPAQVALLRGLAGGGAQVVAVGDPDQAIYGFRGADVRGILHFPQVFADPAGRPARVRVLREARRFPTAIAQAAAGVLGPVSLAPLPARVQRLHRSPRSRPGPARVQVQTYPSSGAEAAGVAETLLRAHAGQPGEPGLAWSQMAVLVRNPAVHGPALTRAMRAAGIPVWLPPDESPLVDEPAVDTLLAVVGLALDPEQSAPGTGRALLSGPLGRADAMDIRALARELLASRRRRSSEGGQTDWQRVASDVLLTAAVASGAADVGTAPPAALTALRRVTGCVAAAREAIESGQGVSEVLWAVWTATDWPDRLKAAALRRGSFATSSAAHRDLDAVVALFEMANRLPPQRAGRVGMAAFLDDLKALRLPQEMRAVAEPGRDHVRLLSAHRAKGLEWELVVVASVQEGQWPDVRLRSDLLHVDELGATGRVAGQTHADLLAEERRLMYVACTRARRWLVVTAVAERVEGGLQASRFLPEIGPVQAMPARSASPMSAEGLVTALREAAEAPRLADDDPAHDQVEALRGAALQRLATLASLARTGGPLGPLAAADPVRWWAAQPLTTGVAPGPSRPPGAAEAPGASAAPCAEDPPRPAETSGSSGRFGDVAESLPAVRPADRPADRVADQPQSLLRLSPSSIASLRECPLRWFLERRVGASSQSGSAATVGVIVHAVAEALARGDITDEDQVRELVDEVWSSVPFAARYERARERARVDEMVASLVRWDRSTGRSVAAAELGFRMVVADVTPAVQVSGSIDRVDRAPDGSLHVVDFKTGKSAVSKADAAANPQLGLYQLAIRRGALPESSASGREGGLGGAELVHLGDPLADGMPKLRTQPPLDDGVTWVDELIVEAARLATGPDYPARVNSRCARCSFRYLCPAQAPAPAPAAVSGPAGAASEPTLGDGRLTGPRTAGSPAGLMPPVDSRPVPDEPEPVTPNRRAVPGPEPVQEPLW